MNINDMKTSRFVSKSDLPKPPYGLPVTIVGVGQEGIKNDRGETETKYTLAIKELDKPFVLNITNAGSIGALLGSDETNDWKGGKVEIYYDPTISMGGKIVGGMRIRMITPQTSMANNEFDDDIPL